MMVRRSPWPMTQVRFIRDFDPSKDYYSTLGVTKNATDKFIKQAYYKMAMKFHPDKNKGKTTEKFKEIAAAYEVLGDKHKKHSYDSARKGSHRTTSSFTGADPYSYNS